jgi:hypothetical protein
LCGALCALVLYFWQATTVAVNYGGNWTALYNTGELPRLAPLVEQEHVYIFRGSTGYDGQFYHLVAHDPFLKTDLSRYADAPRFRWGRILLPGLAWLMAFGRQAGIDGSYTRVMLLFAFAGAASMAEFALRHGRSPWWGFAFLLIPSTLVSADRLTLDLAFTTLCIAFAVAVEKGLKAELLTILTLAPLCRETGLLLTFAYIVTRVFDRDWRRVMYACATAIPFVAWTLYVRAHTPPYEYITSYIPLSATLKALVTPQAYMDWPRAALALQALDVLGLLGMLLAFGAALFAVTRDWRNPRVLGAGLFAVAGIMLQRFDMYTHVFAYGRVYGPLFALVFLDGLARRKPLELAPVWLTFPRVAAQLAPQVIGIVVVFLR